MIASSATVLENLGYLIGAVVLAVIGGLAAWLHHRQPKSVDANMASFRRGLSALAPDPQADSGPRPRPAPRHLTHVRLESVATARPGAPFRSAAVEEASAKDTGGDTG